MEETQQQEPDSSASSDGPNFFTCEICVEIVQVNSQFKSMEMSGSLHLIVIEHNISEIKCPNPDCNVMLDASLCQSALPNKVFEKWCCVLCESAVLLESSKGGLAYRRSYCPFRDFSELILNDCVRTSPSTNNNNTSNKITISNCPNCKKLFCFHYWNNVQIATRSCVKPDFATTVEGRDVYASTAGASVCSICF
ncbi:hypothetical protein MKX01_000238 [Papaver californicum]|nr:hypothetical protein MKX01_000238 [Papaver californicum]